MSDYDKTGKQMLQIDHKQRQKEQNYRRAEAFLLWKFGPMYDEARRFLRGSGMDWPSLFVEFVEKVEEELLAQMRGYEETAYNTTMAQLAYNTKPQFIHLSEVGEVTEEMAKAMAAAPANPTLKFDHWSTDDFFKSPLMGYAGEARKSMRRHWKDDPGAYATEELEKLKAEDDGERQ